MTHSTYHIMRALIGLLFITLTVRGEVKLLLNGGRDVGVGELPWIVGVSLGEEVRKLICGGSILSSLHVLTAGRCVTDFNAQNHTHVLRDPNLFGVTAGDISRMEDEDTQQIKGVREIFLHPEFQYDGGYNKGSGGPGIKKGFLNDLAILVLDSPLNFTEGVKSISLDSSCSEMFEQNVTIGGWGITEKRQNTIPTGIVLKKVTLPLYAPTDKPPFKRKFGLWMEHENRTLSMIATFSSGIGSNQGLMGRCLGDTGGAVVVSGQESSLQCGVISFGVWCDRYLPNAQFILLNEDQVDWIMGVVDPKFWTWVIIFLALLLAISAAVSAIYLRRKRRRFY